MATATSLALERGFSDSIFGLTLVYAGLVMYDAQGVRREVGIHAKTINRALLENQLKSLTDEDGEDEIDSVQGKSSSSSTNLRSSGFYEEPNAIRKEQTATPLLVGSRLQKNTTKIGNETGKTKSYALLKESIGHTEVEVIAGALLGFLVSLTVHAIM